MSSASARGDDSRQLVYTRSESCGAGSKSQVTGSSPDFNSQQVNVEPNYGPRYARRQSSMSKHFELMQQLEKEQPFDSASSVAPTIAFEGTKARSTGQRRWADDEALRIVQQIFVQVQKAPHV